MNRPSPFIDLDSPRAAQKALPAEKTLQLPFENRTVKILPAALAPGRETATSPSEPPASRAEALSEEMRSLYRALDSRETQRVQRIRGLQKRLIALEGKIAFQQRCLAIFMLLFLGWTCFALTRAPEKQPAPTSEQSAPPQIYRDRWVEKFRRAGIQTELQSLKNDG